MFPEKYIKDLERAEKTLKRNRILVLSLSFLAGFLVGPVIHELSHIAVLQLSGCTDFTVSYGLLNAEIQPLCSISGFRLGFFYLAGYTSTLFLGALLTVLGRRTSSHKKDLMGGLGLGTMASVLVYITRSGDIESFLQLARLSVGLKVFFNLAVIALILPFSKWFIDHYLEELERQKYSRRDV